MRRGAIASLGLVLDAVAAADAPPPPGLPAGPTNFRDDDELRALFEAAGFVEVGVSHLHFETPVADADTLWRGVLDSAVRIPPLVTEQPATSRPGSVRRSTSSSPSTCARAARSRSRWRSR